MEQIHHAKSIPSSVISTSKPLHNPHVFLSKFHQLTFARSSAQGQACLWCPCGARNGFQTHCYSFQSKLQRSNNNKRITANFSTAAMKSRREQNNIFKLLRENNSQLRIACLAKPFKMKGK